MYKRVMVGEMGSMTVSHNISHHQLRSFLSDELNKTDHHHRFTYLHLEPFLGQSSLMRGTGKYRSRPGPAILAFVPLQ
jgi:hypothetical protein